MMNTKLEPAPNKNIEVTKNFSAVFLMLKISGLFGINPLISINKNDNAMAVYTFGFLNELLSNFIKMHLVLGFSL